MKVRPLTLAVCLALGSIAAFALADTGPNITDTRLLAEPAVSQNQIAFAYAGDIWTADLDGKNVRRLTSDAGEETNPVFSPGRQVDRLLGAVRGQRRRLCRPRAGRRAPAPDLASRRRPRAVLHARRQGRPLHVAADRLHGPLPAALHGAGRRRRRNAPRDPQRGPGDVLARRQAPRLQPGRAGLPAVEALPRRPVLAALDLHVRQSLDRKDPAAPFALERRRPDVDGRHHLLPLRPRRRVQPLRLRHEDEGGQARHEARRLSRAVGCGRRGPHRLRAGGISPHARPADRLHEAADDRRRSRPGGLAPAFRQGREVHPLGLALALGLARGLRVPRRDPDAARREGRRAQSHAVPGRARPLADLVARRQVDRVFLRRVGRVPALRPLAGRQGRGQEAQAPGLRLLRSARLVAGQQEDRLHRQLLEPLLSSTSRRAFRRRSAPSPSTARARRCEPPGRPTRAGSPTR